MARLEFDWRNHSRKKWVDFLYVNDRPSGSQKHAYWHKHTGLQGECQTIGLVYLCIGTCVELMAK